MLFNSIDFLIFFPIVTIIYFILPNRIKYIWLLISSYYFYMSWNIEYAFLMLTSTFVTYISGLLIQKVKSISADEICKTRRKKIIVILSFAINLAILFYFKYLNFAISLFSYILDSFGIRINIPDFNIILPVGISFYTFQALSYTMDVYRDDIYAEKNFFRYALFVSFFPQLVAGPIERSKNLLKQLAIPQKFNWEMAKEGVLLMLWGYFLKIVLADRIAIFVDNVYENYEIYCGYYIVIATMLFAIQIYCDFAGYSIIAMGSAMILGIRLMENFDVPYLSTSVSEFWRRWHISLTSWFKDYLYIPLGGSRKGKLQKYCNKLIVFLTSGLWHGASLSFVIWGGLNGIYQIAGDVIQPIRDKAIKILGLNRNSLGHKLIQIIGTFFLVDFTWIFFRAGSTHKAIQIIRMMFSIRNPWILFDGSLYQCGLDIKNFWLMIFCIVILLCVDIAKRKGICIRKIILNQDYWVRWLVIDTAIIILLVFGMWGSTYEAANFIYFQF